MTEPTEPAATPPDVTAEDIASIPVRDEEPTREDDHDKRFTHGLIYDVVQVLEAHGYRLPPVGEDGDASDHHRALGQTVTALLDLVRTYEGGKL